MMDGHVPAVRLPPRRQRVLLAAVGRQGRGLEGHGTPSATPPAPRAPTAAGTQTTIDVADHRALIAALVRVIPKARQAGLWLVVTPDTVMRWHRDLLRRR